MKDSAPVHMGERARKRKRKSVVGHVPRLCLPSFAARVAVPAHKTPLYNLERKRKKKKEEEEANNK